MQLQPNVWQDWLICAYLEAFGKCSTHVHNEMLGGRHNSVVSSVPNILCPEVRIRSTPSMLYNICIVEIETLIVEW